MTKTFQTEGHDYFTVSKTGADIPESGERVAVHFSEAPKRDEEKGTTGYSMIFPGLIVAECVADQEAFAQTVAEVLNENAHRFFESARSSEVSA